MRDANLLEERAFFSTRLVILRPRTSFNWFIMEQQMEQQGEVGMRTVIEDAFNKWLADTQSKNTKNVYNFV